MLRDGGNPLLLVCVKILGNTLGAVVNWLPDIFLLRLQNRRGFYFSGEHFDRAQRYVSVVFISSWCRPDSRQNQMLQADCRH